MRDKNISILRVFAMLMVVFYHCLCFYTPAWSKRPPVESITMVARIINTIDMPIFIFMSGYLYSYLYNFYNKYRNARIFCIDKVKRLLIPYLFWGVFLCVIMPEIYSPIKLLNGISHLWFLWVLFMMFAITSIKRVFWLSLTIWQTVVIISILMLLLPIAFRFDFFGQWLGLRSFVLYFPAFIIGLYIGRGTLDIWAKKYIGLIMVIGVVTMLIVILFSILGRFLLLLPILGLIVVCCIWLNRNLLIKFNGGGYIQSLDKCSMGIYIIHHIIIRWAVEQEPVRIYLSENVFIAPFLMFFIVLPLSWWIIYVMKRYLYLTILVG